MLGDLVCDECPCCFECVAHVGGNFNNGANAGLWYWNCNNSSTNSNLNCGARLLIFIITVHIIFHSAC
nr:MAG TPA: hypothetical protein [Caudoviricetes sp.]